MAYAKKIILHAPPWDDPALESFVDACIRDGVVLICVVGDDCGRIEDVIDEIVVGRGSDDKRFIITTSHPNEPLDNVMEFARRWCEPSDPPQEVRLDQSSH